MYNYNFDNEEIIYESVENLISLNEKEFIGNILLANNKILLFHNINKNTVLSGRGIHELPQYELVKEIELSDVVYEVYDNNTIIKSENNEIILFNFNLNKLKNY